MTKVDRRSILRGAAGMGLSVAFPEAIKKALAIPANGVTGTINDVQHIVVLMQENRSFDHYFGMLRGVRGFSDPRAVKLYGSGNSVFQQPNENSSGVTQSPATVLPFRPAIANLGSAFLPDLAHGWKDAHGAWNNGRYDKWIANKTKTTMAYLQRQDIPFHYALADAFTICDAYHCSIMSSTDPNRYYLWSGWCGQNGTLTPDGANTGSTAGNIPLVASTGNGTPPYGPVVTNAEAGYNWRTYPERLQNAGVSWKIYQDIGTGLNAAGGWGWTSKAYIGNYGDNSLLYFTQYQNATAGTPLYDRARTGTNTYNNGQFNNGTLFDQLRADVMANTLPQVSWIAAPEAYSEHPNWPASYGAWYMANVLSALTANPEVWASTVLIICYDENDGFFDHMVPPTPPASSAQGKSTVSTVNELYPGTTSASYPAGPYGLGARVPMLIVSPWSKGGWVNSQVFDHTSVIRFIEQRFGVSEPNISPWRRSVCGDLTSALDFSIASASASRLPSTASYAPPASDVTSSKTYASASVSLPATQAMPVQETGTRLARALPYQLQADRVQNGTSSNFDLQFANIGAAGAWFHVRTANGTVAGGGTGPWGYTVEPGKSLSDTFTAQGATAAYDVSVYGPNGFFRRFAGTILATSANLGVQCAYDVNGGVSLTITNNGTAATVVTVFDKYANTSSNQSLNPGASFNVSSALQASYSWYDFTITASTDAGFVCQYAGHVETGRDSVSDPLL
ncbi:MAG: phospholipase C, phosphocholine-specific [Aquabacterium sp.]